MAIIADNSMKVLEDISYVSPPSGSVPRTSLPLTSFDILYLVTLPVNWMQRLFFYEFKYPTLHFTQTILPNLKSSLSLTLQHFFPFAGNLVFPSPSQMPYSLYEEGDSVSFVVKESSSADFHHLGGDQARDYHEFQALVPKIPPATEITSSSNGCKLKQEPVMAIQVTVFPGVGFSIGVGFSHVVADGRTFAHFMKSWASIHSCRGDFTCLDRTYLPSFDRDLIDDPLELASILRTLHLQGTISPNISFNNFRVTYRIKRSEVELLKDWVKKGSVSLSSEPIRMSTFVVTCAYMWVCLNKLHHTATHQLPSSIDSNSISYFHFPAVCREHLYLPKTYFGNCLILRLTSAKKSELLGENGILVAVTAIGREIMEFRKQPFKDAQELLPKIIEKNKKEKDIVLAISSSKFGLYKTDFGWGRPIKTEIAFLRSFGSRSMLCIADNRGDEEGGVEFGLAFASNELDSFNVIFQEGLLKLQQLIVN